MSFDQYRYVVVCIAQKKFQLLLSMHSGEESYLNWALREHQICLHYFYAETLISLDSVAFVLVLCLLSDFSVPYSRNNHSNASFSRLPMYKYEMQIIIYGYRKMSGI